VSLFREVPQNRTCETAGIPAEYCLCNTYRPIVVTDAVKNTSANVVNYLNQLMASYGNYCIPLTVDSTYRAFESHDILHNATYQIVHFHANPNDAILEGLVQLDRTKGLLTVENVSRLSRYGDQAKCVESKKLYDIVPFCYCWELKKN